MLLAVKANRHFAKVSLSVPTGDDDMVDIIEFLVTKEGDTRLHTQGVAVPRQVVEFAREVGLNFHFDDDEICVAQVMSSRMAKAGRLH